MPQSYHQTIKTDTDYGKYNICNEEKRCELNV